MSLRNVNENNPTKEHLEFSESYDFKSISEIVEAMDFLRREANQKGNEDISLIINSAFNLCFCAYYLALRRSEEKA